MKSQRGIEPVLTSVRFRVVTLMVAAVFAGLAAEISPHFSREVRPLLEKHCFKCHGPEKQKGGLRFDTKEGAFKAGESGEKAIVPGRASQSRLIKLISSKDDEERMPSKGEALTAAQLDLLKRWIDAGAEWPEALASTGVAARAEMIVTDDDRRHWSYLPLGNPRPPAVRNTGAVRTPVDRFILARLEENRLAPSPQADARKLVRRIYFDLIGLPPTPEQVEAFIKANARNPRSAVESLFDQLLASPHYGERWARHWLDVVRYADSDGQESDADLPDNLMEEERIRTRFNELDDMIATTGSAMLGLILGCARCHDHNYDPVPRREYYRMLCAFNGGDRAPVPLASLEEVRRHLTRPEHVTRDDQRAQLDFLKKVNTSHLAQHEGEPDLLARIQSFELAYRMQMKASDLTDFSTESKETRELYGLDQDVSKNIGTKCLMARRPIERGVRFVQVYSDGEWDAHSDLKGNHSQRCASTDMPIHGLLIDLKRRGLMDSTLVIWDGEFGRMPVSQGNGGRDHNPNGFMAWMAGAGIKGGVSYGETDEIGYKAVKDRVSVHDLHATMLHLLGMDHKRLTYFHNGRRYRLTDVAGEVIDKILV